MAQAVAPIASMAMTGFGMYKQYQAGQLQEKAMKEQQRMQRAADARDRRRLLREQAMARGQTVNVAAQMGGLGGTGLTGALSGLQNQVLSSFGFQAQAAKSAQKQQGLLNQATQAQTTGSIFSGLGAAVGNTDWGQIGSGLKPMYSSVKNMFNTYSPPPVSATAFGPK